jgi:hypothetical protein
MKQADVEIGGEYRVKIGSRLATVRVMQLVAGGRGRARFLCVTQDTGREIKATAARLRPFIGSRIMRQSEHGDPAVETTGGPIVRPAAIPGVKVNPLRVIEKMGAANAGGIMRFTGRIHVGMPLRAACREFCREVGRKSLRQFPPAFRRGVLHCLLAHHTYNRDQYRQVMGHGPIPSECVIAAALAGDEAARATALA